MSKRYYLLAVLGAVQVFNSVDSMALGLVLEEIRADLSLDDSKLGVLTGIGFAFLYSVVGVTFGRLADRRDRVTIVSLATALSTLLVTACGMAANFVQLLLLRIGVGIGQAGYGPASQSLIADYFNRAERPRANAVYAMAVGASYVIGYGLAGWVNELYGWRVMFMVLGLPGLVVAALSWFTLREPRFERSHSLGSCERGFASRSLLKTVDRASAPLRFKEVVAILWSNMTLRYLLLYWSVSNFFLTALWLWLPVFFVRSHGMNTRDLGIWFAVVCGVGGTVGPLLSGMWASRYAANDERLQLRVGVGLCSSLTILGAGVCLARDYHVAFSLLVLYVAVASAFSGPLWATIQTMVPENMRASAAAVFALVGNFIGNGLGSLAMGMLSDSLRTQLEGESLRYALLATCPGSLWAAWCLWRASNAVRRDLATARRERDAFGNETHTMRPSQPANF